MLLFLLLLLVASAEIIWELPSVDERQMKISSPDVRGHVTLPMSGVVGQGFMPVFVSFQNISNRPQQLTIDFAYSNHNVATFQYSLEPSQKVVQQHIIPIIANLNDVYVSAKLTDRLIASKAFACFTYSDEGLTYAEHGLPRMFIASRAAQQAYPEWFAASKMLQHSFSIDSDVTFDSDTWLPLESAAYTNRFNVIWFSDYVEIEGQKLNALANWVIGGGHLLIVSANNRIKDHPIFSLWTEKRFKIAIEQTEERLKKGESIMGTAEYVSAYRSLSEDDKELYRKYMDFDGEPFDLIEQYRMGMGTLTTIPNNLSVKAAYRLQFNPLFNQSKRLEEQGVFDKIHVSNLIDSWEELELTPKWVIVLLIYAFAIVMGPINFALGNARSRMFVLFSTPVLSIVCVVVVILISAALQTKRVLGLTTDISTLDQRNQNLLSSEHRLFFLNARLDNDLRPTVGNHILPVLHFGEPEFSLNVENGDSVYKKYVESRGIHTQWVWHDTSSRLKLKFNGEEVINGLNIDIDVLFYKDSDQNLFEARNIKNGQNATLISIEELPKQYKYWTNKVFNKDFIGLQDLPANTFLLRSTENSFGYHDQVSQLVSKKDHIIYGVLP